jgi:putative resolvase
MALVKIGKAAAMLGVAVRTLRAWEASGELISDRRSKGGVRYYDVGTIIGLGNEDMPPVGYARVSSHDQKSDLVHRSELLEAFCAAKGWRHAIISSSGLNDRKKELHQLLALILHKRIRRLVLTHKDRLLRFGSELLLSLREIQNIEIVILNKGDLHGGQPDAPLGRLRHPALAFDPQVRLRGELPQGAVCPKRRPDQGCRVVPRGDTRTGRRIPAQGSGGLARGTASRRHVLRVAAGPILGSHNALRSAALLAYAAAQVDHRGTIAHAAAGQRRHTGAARLLIGLHPSPGVPTTAASDRWVGRTSTGLFPEHLVHFTR